MRRVFPLLLLLALLLADWLVANGYYDRRRPTEYTNDFLPV